MLGNEKSLLILGAVLVVVAAICLIITLIFLNIEDQKRDVLSEQMWNILEDIADLDTMYLEKLAACLDSDYRDQAACRDAALFAESIWQKQTKWMELATIRGQPIP